jgi:hypothetical protein
LNLQVHPFVGPRLARTLTVGVSSRRRVTHLVCDRVKLVVHLPPAGDGKSNRLPPCWVIVGSPLQKLITIQ